MSNNNSFVDSEGGSVDLYTIRSWQQERLVACGISPPSPKDEQEEKWHPQQQRQLPPFVPRHLAANHQQAPAPLSTIESRGDGIPYKEQDIWRRSNGIQKKQQGMSSEASIDDSIPSMVTTASSNSDDEEDDGDDDLYTLQSHPSEDEGDDEYDDEYDDHHPTKRQVTGATVTCALAGFVLGGPVGAIAGAASSAYLATTPTKYGKMVRLGGETVANMTEQVGDRVMNSAPPQARETVAKSTQKMKQATRRLQNLKFIQNIQDFDKKHQVRQRALCGCVRKNDGSNKTVLDLGHILSSVSSTTEQVRMKTCIDEDALDHDDNPRRRDSRASKKQQQPKPQSIFRRASVAQV